MAEQCVKVSWGRRGARKGRLKKCFIFVIPLGGASVVETTHFTFNVPYHGNSRLLNDLNILVSV